MRDFHCLLLKLSQKYASLRSVYTSFLKNLLGAAACEIFRSLPFRNMATYRITYRKHFAGFFNVLRRILDPTVKMTTIVSPRIPRGSVLVSSLPNCRFCSYTKFYSTVWKITFEYVEIKCQLDATEVFIADLIACSTCFGHH